MSTFRSHIAFLFRIVLLSACLLFVVPAAAQDVKRSKKTEIIEGKKYYLHTVEKGQTLYAIAKAYDLTVNDILVENPDALNGIKPGQVLHIPTQKTVAMTPPKDTNVIVHKVEAGQTIYSIAKQYNVPQDSLLKWNPEAKNGLKPGQELKIPKKRTVAVTDGHLNVKPDSGGVYVGNKKNYYHVALMLPLGLAGVDNIDVDLIKGNKADFPLKAKYAVEFYEGALLALDSMKRRGMHLTTHVYDIDEGDSLKMHAIFEKPEFKEVDLIIGPFSPGPFFVASSWAKEHDVAIVSPVSPANRVLFRRPDAMKTLPSTSTQMDQLAVFISGHHRADNVIVISSTIVKELNIANNFRVDLSRMINPEGKDTIPINRGMAGIEAKLKKDKLNVLIIPSNSQAFVSDLMRVLNTLSEKYPIMVYGFSSWMGFDNLDPEYLQKLQFHFVAPYFVDYDSSAATKRFLHRYNDAFNGDASSYAFAGYDVTLFFLDALYTNGTDFYRKLPDLKGEGLQQCFEFYRSDAESGYENRGVHIVQVQDYRLVRVK